jgi:hypothetical protein
VYIALLIATLPSKPRVVWLLPLVWFVLACMRVRHAPLFAVGALAVLADLFPHTRIAKSLEHKGSDLFATPSNRVEPIRERLAVWALPIVLVAFAFVLQIARVPVPVIGHGWAQLNPKIWPIELIDELQAHQNDRPARTRIFNEYAYGGFLIYYAPGYRVFVDDRCELFGDEWLSEFIDSPRLLKTWEQQYGPFDLALVSNQPGSAFLEYFQKNPNWTEVKKTETAVLFKRK